MKLFKRKEEVKACCCGGDCSEKVMQQAEENKQEEGIKILGSGCAKCIALENNTRKALEELQLTITIQHISEFAQIASYGIMTTPALVINGRVVSYGKVLRSEEIKKILLTSMSFSQSD